jgi:Ecdysteroid kinase-like family
MTSHVAHAVPDFSAGFPGSPEEMTCNWLTAMFVAHGYDPATCTVESYTNSRIGTGQIGQNHRYALTFAGTAGTAGTTPRSTRTDDLNNLPPSTLVAKFASPDPVSRGTGLAMGIYAKEAAFYRQFAPLLAGKMRIARAWAAEFDATREATLIVMEDLSPAVQGDQMEGCSVATVEQAVRELAALHATFWEHELLQSTEILSSPTEPMRAMILGHLMNEYWPPFIERYADRLTPEMIELGNTLTTNVEKWATSRTGPLTLSHNDYRADNLMVAPTWTAAVDWQTVNTGFGGSDLGYFLGASMLPADRREHQTRLVELWHASLVEQGVPTSGSNGYTLAHAFVDYRHGQFAGLITAIVSSMITQRTDRGDEMFWAMAGRHLETALELNAVELLL